VRAAANDFEPAADYATARRAYDAKVTARVNEALGRLAPPLTLGGLADLVKQSELGPELIALGQDGAVQYAVRGTLREAGGAWIADAGTYSRRLADTPSISDPDFGRMTAAPVLSSELTAFLGGLGLADLRALSSEPVRGLYGQKALVVPALANLIMRELSLRRLVLVPQEIATGHILAARSR
jgi:hypothetical protein